MDASLFVKELRNRPDVPTSSCSQALVQSVCVSEAVGLVSLKDLLFDWINKAASVTYNVR